MYEEAATQVAGSPLPSGGASRAPEAHRRADATPSMRFGEMTYEQCLEKLSVGRIGRIAISANALPVILPVHYRLNEVSGVLVIRTSRGTKLSAATNRAIVAFEIDDSDLTRDVGWSVVVLGRAGEVTEPERVAECAALGLREITPGGSDDHFVAITLDVVTGRTLLPH